MAATSSKATVTAVDLFEIPPPLNPDGTASLFALEGFFRVRAITDEGHEVQLRVVTPLDKGAFSGEPPYAVGDQFAVSFG